MRGASAPRLVTAHNWGMSRVQLLTDSMERAYGRLRDRLQGLTEEEFSWRPIPDCWTIHQDEEGRWTYDYAIPEPDPAPLTTIAWQVVHVGLCKVMYHEWAFGAARMTWEEVQTPGTVTGTIAVLDQGQALLLEALRARSEAGLDEMVMTNWGDRWPAWRIFMVLADHDALHGGIVGSLRDLYHWTDAKGVSRDAGSRHGQP